MGEVMPNDTAVSVAGYTLTQRVVIITAGTLLSIITAGGNLLVLLSFRIDKSLQIISNYFLFSLACADLAIGLISCPFMTLYTVNAGWTLGYGLCQFWLSVDYLMSNASVWNLLLISLDRYFSVTRPLTYRPKRTTKKALIMIASTYVLSLVLWPPWIIAWPYIEGRFVLGETECMVQFIVTNPAVTIGTIMAAFYIPVTVMVVLYARVFWVTETRNKQLSKLQGFQKHSQPAVGFRNRNAKRGSDDSSLRDAVLLDEGGDLSRRPYRHKLLCCRSAKNRMRRRNEDFGSTLSGLAEESGDSNVELSDDNLLTGVNSVVLQGNHGSSSRASETYTVVIKFPHKSVDLGDEPKISLYEPEDSIPPSTARDTLLKKVKKISRAGDIPSLQCPGGLKPGSATGLVVPLKKNQKAGKGVKKATEKKQERKAAKTLSAILLAFVLTWAPYSIIVCVYAFKVPVPDAWFSFSYYLCYINSTINPILYALCNENFRRTYIRILKCQFRQQRHQKQRGTSAFTK